MTSRNPLTRNRTFCPQRYPLTPRRKRVTLKNRAVSYSLSSEMPSWATTTSIFMKSRLRNDLLGGLFIKAPLRNINLC